MWGSPGWCSNGLPPTVALLCTMWPLYYNRFRSQKEARHWSSNLTTWAFRYRALLTRCQFFILYLPQVFCWSHGVQRTRTEGPEGYGAAHCILLTATKDRRGLIVCYINLAARLTLSHQLASQPFISLECEWGQSFNRAAWCTDLLGGYCVLIWNTAHSNNRFVNIATITLRTTAR